MILVNVWVPHHFPLLQQLQQLVSTEKMRRAWRDWTTYRFCSSTSRQHSLEWDVRQTRSCDWSGRWGSWTTGHVSSSSRRWTSSAVAGPHAAHSIIASEHLPLSARSQLVKIPNNFGQNSNSSNKKEGLKERIALHETSPITELRGVTCHMGSHSVTCHPT